jgi:hypothetical protein
MVHDKCSRFVKFSARMDEESGKEFKEFGKELGIPPGKLASVGCYIIFSVLKDVNKEIYETYGKGFKEIVKKWTKFPIRFSVKPINDIFKNPTIPKEITDEIFDLIMQKARLDNLNNKQEKVINNE